MALHISKEHGERGLALGYTEKIMAKGMSMRILKEIVAK